VLVVFNIVFVKMFIGGRVLSDGRNIKHPGKQSHAVIDMHVCTEALAIALVCQLALLVKSVKFALTVG
jgi:hypothetical protein